jgi:hypothetical protein
MKLHIQKLSFWDVAIAVAVLALLMISLQHASRRIRVAWQHRYPANTATNFGTCASPQGLAFDGSHIWVACSGANSIEEFNASDGRLLRTITDNVNLVTPEALVFDGTNIWVSNSSTSKGMLTQVRARDATILKTYAVGSGPWGMAYDGTSVWVANYSSGDLSKVNVSRENVTNMNLSGCHVPDAVGFDGAHIWVNCGAGTTVQELDLNGNLLHTVTVGSNPYNFAFDGTNMWVVNVKGDSVTKISAIPTGSCPNPPCVVGEYDVGVRPQAVVFDSKYIWVSNFEDNSLTKLLASNGAEVATITGLSSPSFVAFDGGNIWVSQAPANKVSKF